MGIPNYLKQRKHRGWYFQRAVPKALKETLGTVWTHRVSDNHRDALKAVEECLRITDKLIAEHKADRTFPYRTIRQWQMYVESKYNQEVYFNSADNMDIHDIEHQRVIEIREFHRDVEVTNHHTLEQIIDAILERNPNRAINTVDGWKSSIRLFTKITNETIVENINHDVVESYIQGLRKHCIKNKTLRSHFERLKALFKYAISFRWITSSPFNSDLLFGISVEHIPRGVARYDKVIDIKPVDLWYSPDKYGTALNQYGRRDRYFDKYIVTWWIMRYCCCHVSEAEGIKWEDIDFGRNTIWIQANSIRELKTKVRARELPMLKPLRELLMQHKRDTRKREGSIFGLPNNHNPRQFGSGMRGNMENILGEDDKYTPKKAKDASNTVLQSFWKGDPRVVEEINGHGSTRATQTSAYGNITLKAKEECLSLLM
jgi:integrase